MESSEKNTYKSAFDSTTFDENISIYVDKDINDVGSATISPCGRDVAIGSSGSPYPTSALDADFAPERVDWKSLTSTRP
jgi:hypothetical protein